MSQRFEDDYEGVRRFSSTAPAVAKPARHFTKMLVVSSFTFFLKLRKDGTIGDELSEPMIAQALKIYDAVIIFCDRTPREDIWKGLNKHHPQINMFMIDKKNVAATMQNLKELLQRVYNVEMDFFKIGMRNASWINVDKFIIDSRVTFVKSDEHAKAGIVVDKELTMKDLVASRRREAW